ncbi:MAG: hypothetical protein ACREU7_07250 [Burkholderiales bacterium]
MVMPSDQKLAQAMPGRANTPSLAKQLLVGCALALAGAAVQAAEPFALAGHRLGLPYDPVVKDSRYDCESLAGCFLYSVCQYQVTQGQQFAGAPLERISLYFQGERLSGIEAEFPAGQFDAVASTLSGAYGAAEGGGEAAKGALAWRQGSQVLRIGRYARPGRSSVIIAERSFLGELLDR